MFPIDNILALKNKEDLNMDQTRTFCWISFSPEYFRYSHVVNSDVLFGGFDSTENEPRQNEYSKSGFSIFIPYQVNPCFSGQLKDKVRTK